MLRFSDSFIEFDIKLEKLKLIELMHHDGALR